MFEFIRRLLNREPYPTVTQYRRYLAGVPQASPVEAPEVRVGGEWPEAREPIEVATQERIKRHREAGLLGVGGFNPYTDVDPLRFRDGRWMGGPVDEDDR